MAQRKVHRDRSDKPRCEDCYFRRNMLCSLDLDEPCSTFRPNRPEGLVPPRQPVLLMRAPRWAGTDLSRPKPVPATQTQELAPEPALEGCSTELALHG